MTSLGRRLVEAMTQMPVIDAHEHLPPEEQRVARDVDVFTLLGHYTQTDLESAGMSQEQYDWLQNTAADLDERWRVFEPYWWRIRHTSYSRAARLAAQRFYGADIGPDSYREITDRMKAANKPGLYQRVLREACGIVVALTQIGAVPESSRDLLVPLLPLASVTAGGDVATLERGAGAQGGRLRSLADCEQLMGERIAHARRQGVVGYKMICAELPDPPRHTAEAALAAALAGGNYDRRALDAWLTHRALDLVGEAGLPVAVHVGIIWDNWNNFYERHPRYVVPVLLAHRHTNFDLYHAGIPWVREMGVIGKELPNAYLNLCWCHVISQQMSISALNEWLDLVPANKLIGFGGDYHWPVEKVYGHLVMAREDIATVLARRVEAGTMTYSEALELARRMLFDNPRELYHLKV